MKKKQTSVDWLIEQLTPSISLQQKHIDDLKEKAKAMEKEQIESAYWDGGEDMPMISKQCEQYYNETFQA
jgi:hypothetical protein